MSEANQAAQSDEAETVKEAVQPVIQLEKGDLEFLMQVMTVVLLFLIWREQTRGGA